MKITCQAGLRECSYRKVEELDLARVIHSYGKWLKHVYWSTVTHKLTSTRMTNIDTVLATLKEIGYNISVAFVYVIQGKPVTSLPACVQYLQESRISNVQG
jgi:hypothetical protein